MGNTSIKKMLYENYLCKDYCWESCIEGHISGDSLSGRSPCFPGEFDPPPENNPFPFYYAKPL